MKYILKKKWHPSQVEEVGHVFEEDTEDKDIFYFTGKKSQIIYVKPHEIALLVDAGYLKKQKEQECTCSAKQANYQVLHTPSCSMITPEQKLDPTPDLWTEEPPERTEYWYVDGTGIVNSTLFYKHFRSDKCRFKTNNCHKTKQSAEEALKRLLAN